MIEFGLYTVPTVYTFSIGELARWTEENAFESLWFGEHSHLPTNRKTPNPLGGELPTEYKMFFDPFVGLATAAAATTKLKLGTAVCLIPEHNPITLAKTISCLDIVSKGRVVIGIGAGWNEEELAHHGVALKDRWKVTRERVLAMKEIWSKDEAKFHGQFVNFDSLWSLPKPLQRGGPKILLGAVSKWVPGRIADYCDGWLAPASLELLTQRMPELREEMAKAGRSMEELDLSTQLLFQAGQEEKVERRARELIKVGFKRIVFMTPAQEPGSSWDKLECLAKFIRRFQN